MRRALSTLAIAATLGGCTIDLEPPKSVTGQAPPTNGSRNAVAGVQRLRRRLTPGRRPVDGYPACRALNAARQASNRPSAIAARICAIIVW